MNMQSLQYRCLLASSIILLSFFASPAQAISTACSDGIDNDMDSLTDALDPGCLTAEDVSESDDGMSCRVNVFTVGRADQGLVNGQPAGPNAVESGQWLGGTGFSELFVVDPFSGAPSVGVLGYAPFSVMQANAPELQTAASVRFEFTTDVEIAYPQFLIGRYGSETNTIRVDGVEVLQTAGQDGVMQRFQYGPPFLPALQPGPHSLEIAYVQDGANGGNYLDFVALNGCPARPACSDGWDNDGDGLADFVDPGCTSIDQNSEASPTEKAGAAKIFQIGKFTGFISQNANSVLEFLRGDLYFPEMTYKVVGQGTDTPPLAGFLSNNLLLSEAVYPDGVPLVNDGRPLVAATNRINLQFTLESDVDGAEVRLTRMGNEINTILLDGTEIAQTVADSGVMRAFYIPAGDLKKGEHTLSIQYAGGGLNNGNYWDAIALIGYPNSSSLPEPTPTPDPAPTPAGVACSSVDLSTVKASLAATSRTLKAQSSRLNKQLRNKNYSCKAAASNKKFAARARKDSLKLISQMEAQLSAVPDSTLSCTAESAACQSSVIAFDAGEYSASSTAVTQTNLEAIKRIKRCYKQANSRCEGGVKECRTRARRRAEIWANDSKLAQSLTSYNTSFSSSIPLSGYTCSAQPL